MSSPIRHTDDLDAALRYAPPRPGNEAQPPPARASEPPLDRAPWHRRFDDTFSGDHPIADVRRPTGLDPDTVPEPPPEFADDWTAWRIALPVCGAAGIAAVIAWAIVSVPTGRSPGRETASAVVPASPIATRLAAQRRLRTATATVMPAGRPEMEVGGAGEAVPEPAKPAPPAERADADATVGERAPPLIAPQPPAAEPSRPSLITRRLDREEVASLVKRGEDFIASGDIASARLVLRRAAEAGDERAALTLAGTFDANLLAKLGMEGVADAAMARLWYERAKQFGSAEASRRLQQLATKAP